MQVHIFLLCATMLVAERLMCEVSDGGITQEDGRDKNAYATHIILQFWSDLIAPYRFRAQIHSVFGTTGLLFT